MRLALVAALCSALLLPAAAAARSRNPVTCAYIARKLVHYDDMRQRAVAQGKDVWVERIDQVIDDTEHEFMVECPEQAAQQRTAAQLRELLKLAGRAALTFFTMGMM